MDAARILALERQNRELRRANNPEGRLDSLRDRDRRSTEEVVAFIGAHRDHRSGGHRWGVEPICAVLQVAPSTYYDAKTRAPAARAVRDSQLGPALRTLGGELLGLRPADADQRPPAAPVWTAGVIRSRG